LQRYNLGITSKLAELVCVGLLVVPGLVDIHVHGYQYATPLGIDVDDYCLGRGVTTAVDAGRYTS
jgi:predicted amidohydrolase